MNLSVLVNCLLFVMLNWVVWSLLFFVDEPSNPEPETMKLMTMVVVVQFGESEWNAVHIGHLFNYSITTIAISPFVVFAWMDGESQLGIY